MSTPISSSVTPVAKASISAVAEVKKNSLRFSPKLVEPTHHYVEKGFAYMAVEVATGIAVKGFPDENSCNKFCEELNAQ